VRTSALLAAAALAIGATCVTAPAGAAPVPKHQPVAGLPGGVDPERSTVLDFQNAMNSGRLTSVQLVRFYEGRIAQLNPLLHAVIAVNPDAERDAAASDAHRRQHGARSDLEGVPVLLKDNVDTADREPTTAGSLALAASTPARDAFLAARLRAAGAVILGKANMSEWAGFRSFTNASNGWSAVGGQTNNPYVLDRNPCGSSSGSAAAVAAWLAPVAIGTETHGSITCPASMNGIAGIKPTLGLVSRSGIVPISAEQDTAGPLTRNVTDAAALLSVIAGTDPADPATAAADAHRTDLTRFLRRDALHGKRIGVWAGLTGGDAEVDPIFAQTVDTLRKLGATTVPVSLTLPDDFLNNEIGAAMVEFKHGINAYLAARPGPHPADLAGLIQFNIDNAAAEMPFFGQDVFEAAQATSGDLSDPAYRAMRTAATSAARDAIDSLLQSRHLDAIVSPTSPPAWVTDNVNGDPPLRFLSSPAAAVAGYPHIAVPMGFVGALPVGVSFFAGRWSEPTLIGMAYAYEQHTRARQVPQLLPTIGTIAATRVTTQAVPTLR
jgi:amidase